MGMPSGNERAAIELFCSYSFKVHPMHRAGFFRFILTLIGLLVIAPFARAAEKPNIFDPADIPLGIWSIVVFVILLVVLKKYAWGPILVGLQKREHNIESAVQEAQKARDEAQRLRDQLQREIDHAQEKVRDILDEGRKHAQQTTDEMIGKARTEIQSERDRLRREIEIARDQALHELWKQTADLATLVSAKAIRRQLTPDDHRRLVDEALTELKGAGVAGRG
jgi:F-type H+-transporting ATPase subunit b